MSVRFSAPFLLLMGIGGIVPALGQWSLPVSVVLDGTTATDRQIDGLALPEQPTDGANASAERNASLITAHAVGVNDLVLTITPTPVGLAPGMRIIMIPEASNTASVTVDVNGQGPRAVHKDMNVPLDSADLRAGVPIQLIYDGVSFQVATQLYPGCPTGMKAVGRTVCIETTSREPASWYAANSICVNAGSRLCGFADWIQACLHTDNMLSTVLDYEWVDEAANSVNTAKRVGINATTLLPDCTSGGIGAPTTTERFRCCYDR